MSMPSISHMEQPRQRLPTLFEVLNRRTLPPVDLFSFYIYMRDQQRSVDYLDFWLDVSQHTSLCRHYVRSLHRSIIEDTPEMDKSPSKRSSQYLDDFAGPSTEKDRPTPDQRLSAFLRSENGSRQHSPQNSHGSNGSKHSTPATEGARPSFMDSATDSPAANSDPRPTRADIRASAEKILYTYLLQGSEREIIIPQGILSDITEAIEGPSQRSDPEVFDAAKDYVFQAMERDAFPGFLRRKGFGNLVPPSMMLRLVVGLLSMFGALWTSFVLIFLNASRRTRCWVILPFTVAVYALASHQYMLDPIMVLAGYSENTFMGFNKVREPFIRKMLVQRAYMVLLTILFIDGILSCIFIFVPGKRL